MRDFLDSVYALFRRSLPFFVVYLAAQMGVSDGLAGVVVGFPNPEAEQRRPEYLGYNLYRRELLRHGFQADLCPEPLQWPRLKEFNVIVYGGFSEDPGIRAINDETRKRAASERQALEKFVSNGGGLIVLPTLRRYPGQEIDEYYNLVLGGFGLKILSEGIWDPAHQFKDPGTLAFAPMSYFMTAQIKQHPVTQGVERLAFPQTFEGAPAVAALSYSKDWTVLVTGETTAQSFKRDAEFRPDLKQPGTYKTTPPIVAVRSFGKGRVLSYPLPSAHVSLNFGKPNWPQTAESAGDIEAKKPSYGHQLMLNAIAWVSEPSQKMPEFGTRKVPEHFPPMQWEEEVHLPLSPKLPSGPIALKRGIIGVHSNLSDGRGSVEEYAQAAKEANLQFVIFAENLEQLSAEKWKLLVEKCSDLSRQGSVCLLPGYEYSDVNGVRWAIWGRQVVYPRPDFFASDGKRIFRNGNLDFSSNFAARMVLDYKKLPGDPSNLWWFYNVPLWVYDQDKLLADNVQQYLLARDNLFAVTTACFTRIKSPQEVAIAARRCTLNVDPSHHPNIASVVDTSASQWSSWTSTSQGGENGPSLTWVELAPTQSDESFYRTRGAQRVRGTFRAYAKAGLREVCLHDGTRGMIRRYLCNGAKEFSRTFELVHDRQHELVLEAVDTEGLRSIASAVRLFSYKQGIYRCGDNLNLLGSTPTLAHPDRQEFPRFPLFEDYDLSTLDGFDSGSGRLNQPQAITTMFTVRTKAGEQEEYRELRPTPDDSGFRIVQTPLRFPFSSYEINVVEASSRNYVRKPLGESAQGPFLPVSEGLPYATIDRRVYLLRSRMNYILKWNQRRPHEAAADYKGDIFVQEGTVRFCQDATLKGVLPVVLDRVVHKGGSDYGQANRILIADAERGDITLTYGPHDKHSQTGALRKGGWIAGNFTQAGTLATVPINDSLRYEIDTHSTGPKNLQWSYFIGLGRDGQVVRTGEELKYRYLAVCISSRTPKDDKLLQSIGQSFILDPRGVKSEDVEVGQLINTQVFVTGRAKNHEFVVKFRPTPLMIDRPFRIEGVEDNGCVAVYALEGNSWEKHFRFVGVFENEALFQCNTDHGPALWIGNPFYAEDARLRLTLVADGLRPGELPFLEVHNPTYSPIKTVIRSPQHTPKYGGFSKQLTVPAGDSVFIDLPIR